MKRNSPKFGNNFIYGYNIDDETSGVATLRDEDDLKNICINKKELQDFKDDKSLTVDYGFDDDHTISNEQNVIFKEKTQKDPSKEKEMLMASIHAHQMAPASDLHKKTKTNILWKFIGGDNSFEEDDLHRKHHTNELSTYLTNDHFFSNYNTVSDNNMEGVFNQHAHILNAEKFNARYHQRKMEGDYADFDNFKEDDDEYESQSPVDNKNNKQNQMWSYGITHSDFAIVGKQGLGGSVASYASVPSFGITRSQQIEKEYKELKQHYDAVLGLLQYWQEFYKDVMDIVEAKKILKMENADEESLTSNEFRQTVVKLVKELVLQAKKRVYHIFNITREHNFIIWSSNTHHINKQVYQIVSKVHNIHIQTLHKQKKMLYKVNDIHLYIQGSKQDIENDFPPILLDSYKHIQKYKEVSFNYSRIENSAHKEIAFEFIHKVSKETKSTGIQTYNDNKSLSIRKEVKESKVLYFPTNKTQFDKAVSTFIGNKLPIKPRTPIITSSNNNNNYNNSYKKRRNSPSPLQTKTPSKPQTPSLLISTPFLFQILHFKKRKTTRESQTDLNIKHLDSIELMNKEYSTQLAITQKDKEKMQKLYEDKIQSLNIKIEEQNKTDSTPTMTQSIEDASQLRQSNSNMFLPELIPPEQTYKIFIHCVKHFKYEETLYRKFMEEADVQYLKAFIAKMEKMEQSSHNKNRNTKNYVSKYLKMKQQK